MESPYMGWIVPHAWQEPDADDNLERNLQNFAI
jgi:hypothetical protein